MEKAPAAAAGRNPGAEAPGTRPVHDVLVAIPLRHRLSTKLFGMAAALALAALAALWLAERRIQNDLVAGTERSTALLAESIQASTEDAMLGARPKHAYDHLARIAALEGVEQVRVLDKAGRVVWSSAGDAGRTVPKSEGACLACHAGARPLSRASVEERTRLVDGTQGRTLALTSPIYNAPSCSTADSATPPWRFSCSPCRWPTAIPPPRLVPKSRSSCTVKLAAPSPCTAAPTAGRSRWALPRHR